ncbi:hypothetical protein Prudu_002176, partial [Prunus dulcis]
MPDPSLTTNVGGQSVQAGKVIGRGFELPSADEEDEAQVEQTPAEAALSGRRKRKGPAPSNTTRPDIS